MGRSAPFRHTGETAVLVTALVDTSVLIDYLLGHAGASDLLSTLIWHPLDVGVAEQAGVLGRQWLPSHQIIDGPDLAIAATTIRLGARLLTLNVRHFPMIENLVRPY